MPNNFNEEAKVFTLNKVLINSARFVKKEENIVTLIFTTDDIPNFFQEVYIVLTNEVYGLFTYRCITQEIIPTRSPNSRKKYYSIQFYVNENVSVVQRRRDIKVKVKLYLNLTALDLYGKELPEKEQRNYRVMVRDISASGMLFISKEKFSAGQKFSFLFDQSGTPFLVFTEIVRVQKENDTYGYGCRFSNLNPTKESVIRQYVYKMQIVIRKTKEMLQEDGFDEADDF